MKVIFETPFGSHLFGTSTPQSDFDFKGVYIPEKAEIILPKIPDVKTFNTGDKNTKNVAGDVDRELYAVHKYFEMIAKGDMIACELLFAPVEKMTQEWQYITENRQKLLSRSVRGFVGYVQRQANTYGVKGERLNEIREMVEWLYEILGTYPVKATDKLSACSGIENEFAQFCVNKKFTNFEIINNNQKPLFHLVCCDRKVPLSVSFHEALKIYENVVNQYGNRAKAAASNSGVDWKAISHAIRIGEEAVELLSTGFITFPRPNADYLLRIKTGQEKYEEIADRLDYLLAKVENLSMTSTLPEFPDLQWMISLRDTLYENMVRFEVGLR
jgi:hypothetical protein